MDKNGAQVLLIAEDTDFLEAATQLANTAGYDVVVKVTPAQIELDAEPQEAEGQTEMFEQ
ncbi:hypothetical protein [Pediococcus pentosaceus]|uniref:hypothetical protein n=1 Tax=Pediococcus pentosaceus TaxID=1255 RepID=UPI001E5AB103|nr:hypothetical protein [Pediococcus pentosaceus]